MKVIKWGLLISILLLFVALVGCNSESQKVTEDTGDTNATENNTADTKDEETDDTSDSSESVADEMRVAIESQPPTLDPLMTTTVVSKLTARNMYESLLTFNSNFEPVPMLAESVEKSEDSLTYTFHLRQGILFHNGEEMTSEDVVASMNRWMEKSSVAKLVLPEATFEGQDDYTVVMQVKSPSSEALDALASEKNLAAIMPKEVVESAEEDGVTEHIGTGPYQLEEIKQDQYIHFTKFQDYQLLDSDPDGLSGKKEALAQNLYFDIVPDTTTRLSGVQTGEYDVIYGVPYDNLEQLNNDPNVETYTDLHGSPTLVYNKKQGLFTDNKMRQAVNAALNLEEIMMATFVHDELYRLDPGYMVKEYANWHSDAGSEVYNQNDPEKAKKLLEEAGYNGEEIKLMTTRDFDYLYNIGVVVQEQLQQAGMNVKLEIYDWPTVTARSEAPENWDLYTTSFSVVNSPSQVTLLGNDYTQGWTDDPKINELKDAVKSASSQEEAKEYWDELQGYAWTEYLPAIKVGDFHKVYATTNKVEGFKTFSGAVHWNTTVTE